MIGCKYKCRLTLVALLVAAAGQIADAQAASYLWTGASGANLFKINANWSPNAATPGVNDTATFSLNSEYEVSLATPFVFPSPPTDITVANLDVLAGDLTLSNSLIGAYVFPETLTVTHRLWLPNANDGTALTLGSPGFPVNVKTNFLDLQNDAIVLVRSGSHLDTAFGSEDDNILNGYLIVEGAGSHLGVSDFPPQIGAQGGRGAIEIEDGAVADITDPNAVFAVATDGTSSTGVVNVFGENSALNVTDINDPMIVGSATLGMAAVNVGALYGGGGALSISSYLTINKTGTVTIGSEPFGSAPFTGTLNANDVDVKGGVLRVSNGSFFNLASGAVLTIENGGTADFRSYTPNRNQLRFISGSLSYRGNLLVGAGGLLGDGDLTLDGARQLSPSGATTIDPGRTLTIAGGLLHTGPLNNNGTLALESGTCTTGHVTLNHDSSLQIFLGGTTPNADYGVLDDRDILALDGKLAIVLLNGFMPAAHDSFHILNFEPHMLFGAFTTIQLPALATGLQWDASALYTSGILSVASIMTADFDSDGNVNANDLALWRGAFGAPTGATHMQGDADGDGDADGADLLLWQRQLGSHSSVGAVAVVPEPRGLVLAFLALAAAPNSSYRGRCAAGR